MSEILLMLLFSLWGKEEATATNLKTTDEEEEGVNIGCCWRDCHESCVTRNALQRMGQWHISMSPWHQQEAMSSWTPLNMDMWYKSNRYGKRHQQIWERHHVQHHLYLCNVSLLLHSAMYATQNSLSVLSCKWTQKQKNVNKSKILCPWRGNCL